MALTKTPFFGLDSHGTVGGFLTSQKRGSATLLREKPLPTDPYSLNQAYQRWLYEDYAYLWTQQSIATRQAYATAGSRHHLTGFQYWMKYQLTNLPDIAGMWHLDEKAGAIAYDSSRNSNNGTIFGASPSSLAIDGAHLFDNLNDYISCPHHPSLNFSTDSFTYECFISTTDTDAFSYIISKRIGLTYFVLRLQAGKPGLYLRSGAAILTIDSPTSIADAALHHLVARIDRSANLGKIFVDTIDKASGNIATHPNFDNAAPLVFAAFAAGTYHLGATLDHIIGYNRTLDLTEITRHSLRRYPA